MGLFQPPLPSFAELTEQGLELLLRLAIGRPVAPLDRLLAPLPGLPGPLDESGQRPRHHRSGPAVRALGRGRVIATHPPAEDTLEGLLEGGLHGDLIAEGDDDPAELR